MPTLEWVGKDAIRDCHRAVPKIALLDRKTGAALRLDDRNLVIEGDNLLALRALLPEYAGRVKCVYIDPPYNTGHQTWVYNDAVDSPRMRDWLGTVVGADVSDLSRHDKWLCMMYPRLRLLRELLRDDGVIFVSIDETELANLIAICDEIFDERNRIAVFTWVRKKKGSNLNKLIRRVCEYVVAYQRSAARLRLFGMPAYREKKVPLLNRANPESTLCFQAGTVRAGRRVADGVLRTGVFGEGELHVKLLNDVRVQDGLLATPFRLTGRFRWSQATVDAELAAGGIFEASPTLRINVSRHDQSKKFKAPASLLSIDDGIGTNEDATDELRALFPDSVHLPFEFPKPTSLVRYLIRAACFHDRSALILDSFAGSGTTGHAVMQLNAADDGQRQFILVEAEPEVCRRVTVPRLHAAQRLVFGEQGVHPAIQVYSAGPPCEVDALDRATGLENR